MIEPVSNCELIKFQYLQDSSSTGSISRNLEGVQLNDLDEPNQRPNFGESSRSSIASATRHIESVTTEILEDDPDFVNLFIKKVDLQINGSPIDQVSFTTD